MSKTFSVPMAAESAHIQFSVYATGTASWKASDRFHVKIGIADVNLGDFTEKTNSGLTQGVVWRRTMDSDDANEHHVFLEVPSDYFLGCKLTLAFEVFMKESISRKSAGVDNLVISAIGVNTCGDN